MRRLKRSLRAISRTGIRDHVKDKLVDKVWTRITFSGHAINKQIWSQLEEEI